MISISDYMTLNTELAAMIDKAAVQQLISFANDCLRLRDIHKEREDKGITKVYHQALFDMKSHELQSLSDACFSLAAARSSLAK